MEQTNRKKLVASAVLIVASIALFLGLTFAWFTDSVTSKGNKIQAGTLGITATKADAGTGGPSYTVAGLNGGSPIGFSSDIVDIEGTTPIISENLWEPGRSNAKLLTVENGGTLAAKVKLQFDVADGGLQDALWFDFVQVKDGAVTGQFEKRPMSSLDALADQQEFHLAGGGAISFILVYGMNESAGNEFQGKAFEATVSILATQDAVEEDGFGKNDYDAAAEYPTIVTSADELTAMAATGGSIELGADVALAGSMTFAADTTLNLNGKTLTVEGGSPSIKAAPGTTLAIEGDGVVNGVIYADAKFGNGSKVSIKAGADFAVNSPVDWAVYAGMGSTLEISGGTYTSSQENAGVIHCLGSSLTIANATVNVGARSMNDSVGIHSNASRNILVNVVVNGSYSSALNFNKQTASSIIQGGAFATSLTADDSPASTIRYQGTLNISDASITHIGTGIMCTTPGVTDMAQAGLTVENCAFNSLGSGPETDFKHN